MTLNELKIGQSCKITKVNGEGALRKRLLDMGRRRKTKVTLHKTAPMGDPIGLLLRGYNLTIRKEEAARIEAEVIE